MSKVWVLNGKFYAGANNIENTLMFTPKRPKALPVDELELGVALRAVFGWIESGEIALKRIEVLDVADNRDSSTAENPLESIS